MYDIIIIGAGPAGMTAAIFARRANKKVLLLEGNAYGGQIINTLDIENYPVESHISGFDFATKLYNQAKDLESEIVFEKVESLEIDGEEKTVITAKNTYKAKAVIIATGSSNRKLGIALEKELVGKGVSYCATCDGAFYKNKVVAIVGGGNTAISDAIYLSDIATKVYLIHRRDSFKAEEMLIEKLKNKENVEFVFNSSVTKLNALDSLNSIEITNNDGSKKELEVDGLFIAIGQTPENKIVKGKINLDSYGYVEATETCKTNIDGIFVAGDNRKKQVRQLVTATSDGAVAAIEAVNYINNK